LKGKNQNIDKLNSIVENKYCNTLKSIRKINERTKMLGKKSNLYKNYFKKKIIKFSKHYRILDLPDQISMMEICNCVPAEWSHDQHRKGVDHRAKSADTEK
jgi:hypothetical protein